MTKPVVTSLGLSCVPSLSAQYPGTWQASTGVSNGLAQRPQWKQRRSAQATREKGTQAQDFASTEQTVFPAILPPYTLEEKRRRGLWGVDQALPGC